MIWITLSIALVFIVLVIIVAVIVDTHNNKTVKSVTKYNRGTRSERDLVLKLLKHGIPEQAIFHDLYLKKNAGGFSQIDMVIAAKVGIIVIEVKDYSGWIFGNGGHLEWTQVLAYGKEKHPFYNPVLQNANHITELKRKLIQCDNIPFYSVIVFYGDCELKGISYIPKDTFIVKSKRFLEVLDNILNQKTLAQYTDKFEIVRVLKEAVLNGESKVIQNRHAEIVKDIVGKHRVYN